MNSSTVKSSCDTTSRPHVSTFLRHKAERLRRQAGDLHEQANRLEQLANEVDHVRGAAEEELYRTVVNCNDSPQLAASTRY